MNVGEDAFAERLDALGRHVEALHGLARSVLSGLAPGEAGTEFRDRIRLGPPAYASLRHPDLDRRWGELEALHERWLAAADQCLEAVRDGTDAQAQRRMDEVFDLSANMVDVIAAGVVAELSLRGAERERLLSAAVDCSDQVVMVTDAHRAIVHVNPAFTELTGYAAAEACGRDPSFLQGPDTSAEVRAAIGASIRAGAAHRCEILNYRRDGSPYWVDLQVVPVRDDSGVLTHWVSVQRDVTAQREQQREIERLAMTDHLTGLLNRRAAEERLAVEWKRARREKNPFAVALVDADRFKLVNDQYGHHVGDQVLAHLSRSLEGNLRGGDWLCRWGGEEFLMCLHGLDAAGAVNAGERARRHVKANPVPLPSGGELPITVSIGVALYSPQVDTLEQLVAEADALLYEAKHAGRDRVMVAGRAGAGRGGLIWEGSQVQSALHEHRVLPAFQDIVDLHSGARVGEEALARIRTREGLVVEADRFIIAAEALHLVNAIDRVVTRSALEHASRLLAGDDPVQAYFINLSAQSLVDRELVQTLCQQADALRTRRGGSNPVVIEITERQTAEMGTLRSHLEPLLAAGFRLALDDFGSGYSSFRYLAELPVHFLKLEGWMVRGLLAAPRVRQLVETIVSTARTFGLMTVAECVEDAATAQVLRDIGVDWAQGHHFARPRLADGAAVD